MRPRFPLLVAAAVAVLAPCASSSAGTIEVTTLLIDAPPSECELDEAMIMVNDFPNDDRFGCERNGGGPDVIVFDGGVEGTIRLDASLPAIQRTLTIRGRGADRLVIDGDLLYQAFTVAPGVTFALEAIAVERSVSPGGNGGALLLLEGAVATLRDCAIAESVAANGGGIYVDEATLRIERCLLADNEAAAQGGALHVRDGDVEIVNTTISGSVADEGGGIAAVDAGAGGTTSLYSVTLADNGADAGGQVLVTGAADLTARHTLFAGDAGGGNCDGVVTSLGWNLSDDGSCALDGDFDQEGVAAGLGPLEDNGGPTRTHALLAGSAAIDPGPGACTDGAGAILETDQRGPGFPRRTDGDDAPGYFCDVGAYERAPEPAAAAGAAAAVAALAALARRRRVRVP